MADEQHHGELGEVVHGLVTRTRGDSPRRDSTWWIGVFAMVNGGLSTALTACGALATGEPLVFPSLGPTAFMLFYQPRSPAASPRNTVLGHLVVGGRRSAAAVNAAHVGGAVHAALTWRARDQRPRAISRSSIHTV